MKLQSLADLSQLLSDAERKALAASDASQKKEHDGKGKSVRLRLDTGGRKGKTVTLVEGLQHNPQTLEEIAKTLKQYCGAGGTIKDGVIEIQGDQRNKVKEKLQQMNYTVK